MSRLGFVAALTGALLGASALAQAAEITIATVNNADMINMQKLAPKWEAATGNKINWVVLEENVLRQRVTTDIATKGGQFDIITIGSYEAPIWGKQGWLTQLNDLGDDYGYDDLIPSVMSGLSYDGKLYAVPFYAEMNGIVRCRPPTRRSAPSPARRTRCGSAAAGGCRRASSCSAG